MREIRRGSADPTFPSFHEQLVLQGPAESDLCGLHLSGSEAEAVIYVDKENKITWNTGDCITTREPAGHYPLLVMASSGVKSSFPFVPLPDTNQMTNNLGKTVMPVNVEWHRRLVCDSNHSACRWSRRGRECSQTWKRTGR